MINPPEVQTRRDSKKRHSNKRNGPLSLQPDKIAAYSWLSPLETKLLSNKGTLLQVILVPFACQ